MLSLLLQPETENIKLTDITSDTENLSRAEGDTAYLTVSPVSSTAKLPVLLWNSSNNNVVTVESGGTIAAADAENAEVTASGAGFTASFKITVTERKTEEYRINGITVRDNSGIVLNIIPQNIFTATVPVTKLVSDGNTMILPAGYSADGQYKNMMWVSAEYLTEGAAIKVTLPVDNTDGTISYPKAFAVSSFTSIQPLSEAVSFTV